MPTWKLTKKQLADRTVHEKRLQEAHGHLSDIADEVLVEMAKLRERLVAAQDEYMAVVDNVNEWAHDNGMEFRSEYDQMSEKWVESEKGQDVNQWISQWEEGLDTYLDEVEEIENFYTPPASHADALGQLPEEA